MKTSIRKSNLNAENEVVMSWAQVKATERVFFNIELMTQVGLYLNLPEVLSFLEAGIGNFEEVLVAKRMKRKMLEHLMNFLVRGGWGGRMPAYGSATFESSKKEVSSYVRILSHIGCNVGEELEILIDNLVRGFPAPSKSEVKNISSVNESDKATQLFFSSWT